MKNIDSTYVAIGASWLLVGMILGIIMGATNNFQFMPLHAHINLIGFACHAIFGMAYRHWPTMKASNLAPLPVLDIYRGHTDHTHWTCTYVERRPGIANNHRLFGIAGWSGLILRHDLAGTRNGLTGLSS
jgi:hypothetical protein